MTTVSFKDRTNPAPTPIKPSFYFRYFVIAAFLIAAIGMDYWIGSELGVGQKILETARDKEGICILVAGGSLYILLLSLPFIPGVELGILLMCAYGKEGIVFVYFATVLGLVISFLMGRVLPKTWVKSLSKKLGFYQSGENQSDEIIFMLDKFFRDNKWLSTLLINYRYLAIGLLLNMPGASFIGGGGGISFACGISRNISMKLFLLTVVMAVSPVPLLAFFSVVQFDVFLNH